MATKGRVAAGLLTLSAAGFAAWVVSEGFTPTPVIPTKGDVPTIGHGSTRYEDGTPVRMTDPPITRERAAQLARNLHAEEERRFEASIPGVKLTQGEYDLYLDFTGQFGIGNWRVSSMRRELLATVHAADPAPHYLAACNALLRWRKAGGYDCSTLINGKPNKRCWGVWERQLERHAKCLAEQE
jgi:lysozyme